jgi:PGF-CTERM protein
VTTALTYAADSTDGDADTEPVGESAVATASAETRPSDSSGTPVGPGGSGGSGVAGSSGGGSTVGPSGSGGAAGPAGSLDAGNVTDGGGPAPSGGPLGSDADRSTERPGAGVSIPPGTSEIPPSAGPAELFGTGVAERGADDSAAAGPRPGNERPSDDEGGESDDAAPAGSDGSTESPESSPAGDRSSDEAAASDLGYDDAPIRSTAYDLPGFGAAASLAAVAGASLLARRRGRGP